ncbi:MAG: hypothetical protein ACOC44_10285 [Promethearchaeia archaeon]
MRKHGLNRWNWSERAQKWVYVELDEEGNRKYKYQLEPPQEFIDLTMKIKKLNKKLMMVTEPEENKKLYQELMKVSQKMQKMRDDGLEVEQ